MAQLNSKLTAERPDDGAKARIITAARHCFARVGFEGASTRQISAAAGVAQSLVLYHFGSKDTLWRAVMDDLFHGFGNRVDAIRQSTVVQSATERLMSRVRAFIAICAEDADIHRIMTIEGRQPTERLRWLVDRHLREPYQQTCALIRQGQAEGLVRLGDPTLLYYTVLAIAGTAFSLEPEITLVSGDANVVDPVAIDGLIRSFLLVRQPA